MSKTTRSSRSLSLPREVQVIDVPEAERLCSCCGDEMPIIATDARERLEYIPAQMLVHELPHFNRECGPSVLAASEKRA